MPAPGLHDDLIGQTVGGYVLRSRIGEGGMGAVYLGVHRVLDKKVAVKVLLDGVATPDQRERFLREARAVAAIDDPHIVAVYDFATLLDGRAYISMEHLEGESLAAVRKRRGALPPAEAVAVVAQALEGLAAAHARGVVHRDVKPGNVLLAGGVVGRAKLVDFGIARALGGVPSLATQTRTGTTLGTPGYMSPEQAHGDRDIDGRADVFSLGCVLFECLTGKPAFAGEHVMAILAKILLEDAPPLDALVPNAPPALVDLVARMLAKDRSERPQDAGEVDRELGALAVPSLMPPPVVARAPALTTGEQRMVTVVLAVHEETAEEIANAATLAPDRDAPLLARLRDATRAHGVTLERLADGTVLAVLSGAGAIDRAARVALALAGAMPMRVAIATGRAQFEGRLPVGDAIDRAASMLRGGAAAPAAIDAWSAKLIEARFDVRAEGATQILLREKAQANVARTLLGKPTTCVGRERELRVLEEYWEACVSEPVGRIVLVLAPAGVGKTRLAHELVGRVRSRTPEVELWIGRGDPTRVGAPLSLVRQALQSTTGVQDGEPVELSRAKVRARVERHVAPAQREQVTSFLGELVGAAFPDDRIPALRNARREAIVMADQTRRAWENFVIAECSAHPVLLVLEDLHWADGATVSFVDSALRNLGERPLFVLALARPEVHDVFPKLWTERGLQELRLDGLSRKAGEKLAREVLGEQASAETIARLAERAAGNAFFLEELIRAAAEGKDERVPDTVLGVVEQRLVALEPEARRVMRAASVMGGTFWEGAVRAMLGGDDAGGWLPVLADAELVNRRAESRFPGEQEYAFRHEVVRAASYAMLTESDRALGHRLAAEWLERVGERDAVTIAEHWEKCGDGARAVDWYLRAARQANDAYEYDAARDMAERGVACGATGEAFAHLRLAQADGHAFAARNADLLRCARDAMGALARGGDAWFHAAQKAILGAQRLGDLDAAIGLATELGSTTALAGAEVARARALAAAAANVQLLGRHDLAVRLVAMAEHDDDVVRAYSAQVRLMHALATGDVAAHLRETLAVRALYEHAGNPRQVCVTESELGYSYMLHGDYARAEVTLRAAIADARRMGLRSVEAMAMQNLGYARLHLGQHAEAYASELEAVRASERHGNPRMEGAARLYLAEMLLASGEIDASSSEARRAAELLVVVPTVAPLAQAMIARVELARGDLGAARAATLEAMRGVDAAEEGEAVIRLTHAEVLRAAGDFAAAQAAIADARDRLLGRAARISDDAMRASFLSRVPENERTLALAQAWTGA
jgi:hypothetical protein